MSVRLTVRTAGRALRQLQHDPRSVALVLLLPAVLLSVLYFMFDGDSASFDPIALIMLGILPFVVMFLITSIAMLRERTSGTLERLMTTPMGRGDLLFGYAGAFALVAAVQACIAVGVAYGLYGLSTAGPWVLVVVIAVADALLGVALGLLCSAFARTEFQAVQFLPIVVIPQLFVCGLFVPRDEMAGWLQVFSTLMPMTYAVQALQEIGKHTSATGLMWRDLVIILGAALAALILAAATIRRTSD